MLDVHISTVKAWRGKEWLHAMAYNNTAEGSPRYENAGAWTRGRSRPEDVGGNKDRFHRWIALSVIAAVLSSAPRDGFARSAAATVRLQAIKVSDDDGRRPANVTPSQVKRWVEFANKTYASVGIYFHFNPDNDFSELRSTLLNNMLGTNDKNWPEAKREGNRTAAKFAGRIVVFLRHGPGQQATGAGFSWFDYNSVVMPGFDDANHCGHEHVDALAHEVGHFLGLPHTFVGNPFATIGEAEVFLKIKGNKQNAFDGDGFSDTAPDPAIRSLECSRMQRLKLNGINFVLPRANIMSYYDERDAITPMQGRRVRWILEKRIRNAMAMPSNDGVQSPLEAELLQVEQAKDCGNSVQAMNAFGVGSWSGDRQLYCGAKRGGWITVLFSVPKQGKFHIDLYLTYAPDYGRVQVSLDGQRFGAPLDAYAPVVIPSGRISLATMDLAAGSHRLRFDALSKNAESTNYRFGVDCIALTDAREAK